MLKYLSLLFLLFNSTLVYSASPLLVETEWLKKHIDLSDIRLIDMSDKIQYQRFHIPGAIHLPYAAINKLNNKKISYSVGQKDIIKILGLLGITNKDHIVIYDDMAGLHASRLFWELEAIGHKKISLLNGGLVKWVLSGNKVDAHFPQIKAAQYKAEKNSSRSNSINIQQILGTDFKNQNILLDVRSKEEYTGHIKYPRSGHIPGAKWWEWQHAVNFENAFKLQNQAVIKKQLEKLGINKVDTPITLYCQSGHRASHSYFTLRNLGFTHVRLYDGSMSEYSRQKLAPLIKGLKP